MHPVSAARYANQVIPQANFFDYNPYQDEEPLILSLENIGKDEEIIATLLHTQYHILSNELTNFIRLKINKQRRVLKEERENYETIISSTARDQLPQQHFSSLHRNNYFKLGDNYFVVALKSDLHFPLLI